MQESSKVGPPWAKLFIPSLGIAILLVLLVALSGCGEDGTSELVAPGEETETSPLASPPSLAEIQSAADLSSKRTADLEPPHTAWVEAHRSWETEYRNAEPGDPADGGHHIMGPGGRGLPVIGFLEESAEKLDRSEMVRLAGYLGARQEAHKAGWQHHRGPRGREPGGMHGPLADLDMTEEQRMEMMQAMMAFGMGMRELHEAREAGTLTDEEIRDKAKELHQTLRAEMERILGSEKFAELEAERRERMIERAKMRLEHLDELYTRREEALTRILQLDEADAAALSGILANAKTRHQEVLNQFLAGSMETEDMFYELLTLRKEAKAAIYELLDEDQKAILESLERLHPRHRMMRGPM
jgi:hypothetical protein